MGKNFEVSADLSGFGKVSTRMQKAVGKAVEASAEGIVREARAAIASSPASGRNYGGHQASAPGQPPAQDTAQLGASIDARRIGAATAEIAVSAEYGAALELGSGDGRMAPRPFLGPAVEAAESGFQAACAHAVREGAGA